jgi:hypothetical protein
MENKMNLLQAIAKNPKQRDFIYHQNNQRNPTCVMADGTHRTYSFIYEKDEVLIKENGKFVVGKVTGATYNSDEKHWDYYVNTKNKISSLRKISDFKIVGSQKTFVS